MPIKELTPGMDASHYQTDPGVTPARYFDPAVAKEKGMKFAMLKASEPYLNVGKCFKDPAVDVLAPAFVEAGIPLGFYHFVRPPMHGTNGVQQAEFFFSVVEMYLDDTPLPLFLDIEVEGLGLKFLENMATRLDELSGKVTGIYTRDTVWSKIRGHAQATWAKHRPLWVANYFYALRFPVYHIPDAVHNTVSLPAVPLPWTRWDFWQYSDRGDGEFYGGDYAAWTNETSLDLNVYNGSLEEMESQFGIDGGALPPEPPLPPMPPTPVQFVKVIVKTANGEPGWLFFRTRPELYKEASLAVGYGTLLQVLEPEVVSDIEYWHVKSADGREGYVSARKGYTEFME